MSEALGRFIIRTVQRSLSTGLAWACSHPDKVQWVWVCRGGGCGQGEAWTPLSHAGSAICTRSGGESSPAGAEALGASLVRAPTRRERLWAECWSERRLTPTG